MSLKLRLKAKKAIFFDLDGTLIDSSKDLSVSVNYMLKELGFENFDESIIKTWIGNGALVLTKRALSGSFDIDESLDESLVKKALDIMLDYYSKNLTVYTTAYPNVLQTLKELNKRYKMAIITNKPYGFVKPILKALNMESFFDLVLGADSLSKKKPHPMPLIHTCKELDIKHHEAVMVGDSESDIKASKSASIDVVAVSYGYNHQESIKKYNPNIVIDDFKELKDLLL